MRFPKDIEGGLSSGEGTELGRELRVAILALVVRWRLIAGCTLAALLLALLAVWLWPARYEAVAEVMIDPRAQRLTEGEVVPSGLGSSSMGADTFLVDSQLEILTSRRVLEVVVATEGLATHPEFAPPAPPAGPLDNLATMLRELVHGDARPSTTVPPEERALAALRESLDVGRRGNTYVLAITARASDPDTAARIANAVARAYIADRAGTARDSTTRAFTALSGRLSELRQEAARAQREVERFRARNQLLGPEERPLIARQLEAASDRLSAAQAETQAARARAEQAARFANDPLSLPLTPDIGAPSSLVQLQAQLAQAAALEARLGASLMAGHPDMISAVRERNAIAAAVGREADRLVERLRLEYELAREREAAMLERLSELERSAARTNIASVELGQLEQAAAASRRVYESFLTRSREVAEQVGLAFENAQIISEAHPDPDPVQPAAVVLIAAGGVLGAGSGVAFAWALHLLFGFPQAQARFTQDLASRGIMGARA